MSLHPSRAPREVDAPDPALIDACVHCGFCLPSCPTYALWGEEMDSPRGRIYLMKAATDGRTPIDAQYVAHFDRCLGCVACVTACPSGVQYGALIETARARIEAKYRRPWADRLFRAAVYRLFPYRSRMRLLLLPLAVFAPLLALATRLELVAALPRRMRSLIETAPPVTLASLFSSTPPHTPAASGPRRRVALLTGCVQQLIFPETNAATVRVLAAEGCEVVAPASQGCCGALALHAGRMDEARQTARRSIATFEASGADTIVTNAAGCGSAMKEYGHLLRDDREWAERARAFSARVRDVTELVDELGPPRTQRHPVTARVVYQDACHLAHAQGIRSAPRRVLATIPGVELVDAPDDMCCGSAGIYNVLEPEAARPLGERKLGSLLTSAPDIVATANPGCRLQLTATARRTGRAATLAHPIELLDRSIRGTTNEG